jgi:acyl-coenzyme A thioesterase PaaI-like protein
VPDDDDLGGFSLIDTLRQPGLPDPGGGQAYAAMIETLRDFLDKVAAANPDKATLDALNGDLQSWSRKLAPLAVGEREQNRLDLVGRAKTMSPAFSVDGDTQALRGTVTFGRYFLGGGGAVHGGAIPLVFDDLMGRLANSGQRSRSRTAYLNTNYRSITPIGVELALSAWFVSESGRKRLLRGEIWHGDTLCAEAEGLFVALRPGQP